MRLPSEPEACYSEFRLQSLCLGGIYRDLMNTSSEAFVSFRANVSNVCRSSPYGTLDSRGLVSVLHCKAEERLQFTYGMAHQNAESCWQSWGCKAEERLHFTRLFGSGCHIQWVVQLCHALDRRREPLPPWQDHGEESLRTPASGAPSFSASCP